MESKEIVINNNKHMIRKCEMNAHKIRQKGINGMGRIYFSSLRLRTSHWKKKFQKVKQVS